MKTIDITQLTTAELEEALQKRKQADIDADAENQKKIISEENLLVNSIVDEYVLQKENLKTLKELQAESIISHNKKMYEVLGKEAKETKTITLKTNDGKRKVELVYADILGFNSQAAIHIDAIKDILKEKFNGVEEGFYDFVDSILIKNNNGDYDPKLLTKARQKAQKLKNSEALLSEFDKLEKCRIVVGISRYVRAYEKDENNKMQNISINFSSL